MWVSASDCEQREEEKFFHFIWLTCAFLLLKNMFYVTLTKWDVTESVLTSRQLVCKLNFTVIAVHIGWFWLLIVLLLILTSIRFLNSLSFVQSNGKWVNDDFGPKEEDYGKLLPSAINFLVCFQINEPKIIRFLLNCWSISV